MAKWAPLLLVMLAVPSLGACESTQDKSARLEAQGQGLLAEEGVSVSKRTPEVRVLRTDLVQDENGTAAIVKLKNVSRRTLWQLPIAINVRGARKRSVFRNDQPGLEPTLAHVPLLRAGETFTWVNDQVAVADKARTVVASVGAGRKIDDARLPRVDLSAAHLVEDPVSGVAAEGVATNRSKAELRKLVVFAVAWRGRRAVAAGRAQIPRLRPGRRARFQAFLIGDARGARLELTAPPSRLG